MLVDVVNYPSPEAADATVVYAVGDIHGRFDLLLAMESLIARDIAETQPSRAVITSGPIASSTATSSSASPSFTRTASPSTPAPAAPAA